MQTFQTAVQAAPTAAFAPSPSATARNRELDFLRGVAIMMTFMAHVDEFLPYPAKLWSVFAMAWGWGLGVDVFFVLSGFLITRSLLKDISKFSAKKVLRRFWIKRIYRILPASVIWIILASLSAWVFLPEANDGGVAILRSATAALSNTMNFWFTYCADTRQLSTYCGGMQTLAAWWSLSLEEQFYVVFPILLLIFRRRTIVAIVAAVVAFYALQHKAFFNIYTSTRLEGICLGVLLALGFDRLHGLDFAPLGTTCRRFIGASLIVLLIATGTLMRFMPGQSLLLFASAMTVCLLLVMIAARQCGIFDFGLPSRLLERLGVISFSFYLCHESCLAAAAWTFRHVGYQPDKWSFLAYYVTSFTLASIVASVTYLTVEKPFMETGHRKTSVA